LPLKSQFILSGNVRDLQLAQTGETAIPQPLMAFLTNELRGQGFQAVIGYNPVSGFRVQTLPGEPGQEDGALLSELGLTPANGIAPAGLELFAETLQRIVDRPGPPIALVADFASRLTIRADNLLPAEQQSFTRALVASHSVRARPYGTPSRPFFNTVLWITEKEGDLPDWLVVDNPRIRHIPIAKPDPLIRRSFANSLLRGLSGFREADPTAANEATDSFVDETEGLLLTDMQAIAQLAQTESVRFSAISDAVRRYKVGVTEDPWMKIDRDKIRNAADFIRARVKGQDHAITHILDIVKRAVTGVGAPRRGGRPRGVAFLAGPTGVGKTELAKTITSLLFGDESAYIRFDMSEFSAEHSDQRLIGAPPGYVGYDVGGELTNAVREKPFSVVLFDEIEKAHPRILDKFLQVLDDGVLTSGRGDRVYFSESFIIFTSNLGIYRNGPNGERVANVTASNSFHEVRSRVRSEIDAHFKVSLNRPELLNRIGENIIVFDFIRDEVAHQIFDGMVRMALDDLRASQNITVAINEDSMSKLRDRCLADLSNGGRGIRNQVEVHLLNPLARALFDANAANGSATEITDLDFGQTTNLVLNNSDVTK
jgi:energy-coupling factor transporter ATP-binding protein EcfA2